MRRAILSNNRNIVVIADEVHRSQYDFIDGYAAHMRDALPNALFIGFIGTPIELQDANRRAPRTKETERPEGGAHGSAGRTSESGQFCLRLTKFASGKLAHNGEFR